MPGSSSAEGAAGAGAVPFRVLFVCLGNICRSPTAEGVMRELVRREGLEDWITLDSAKQLLKTAGQDFDKLKALAATRDFKPVPLGVTASMTIHNKLRTIDSRNVIAKLDGSDPKVKDEYVVYTAHWDHFGKGSDGIFHGAVDDGRGGDRGGDPLGRGAAGEVQEDFARARD